MIKNFDVIKEQLKELAGVINSFKSEAVQLRLIELVFEGRTSLPRRGAGRRSEAFHPPRPSHHHAHRAPW